MSESLDKLEKRIIKFRDRTIDESLFHSKSLLDDAKKRGIIQACDTILSFLGDIRRAEKKVNKNNDRYFLQCCM